MKYIELSLRFFTRTKCRSQHKTCTDWKKVMMSNFLWRHAGAAERSQETLYGQIWLHVYTRNLKIKFKGYFPPKIDIQTRISGVQLKTQNFTLISNLHTVFYLVAYFQRYITFSDPCQKNEFFVNSKIFPLRLIFLPKENFFLKCPN